jgi:hypothetical protein
LRFENTKKTFKELEKQFGPEVAGIVADVINDKSLDKAVRRNRTRWPPFLGYSAIGCHDATCTVVVAPGSIK